MNLLREVWERLRPAGGQGLAARIRQTTPGQLWTSGLALLVALPVLLFGLPPRTTIIETIAPVPPSSDGGNAPIALPPSDAPTDVVILSGPPPPARGSAPRPPLPDPADLPAPDPDPDPDPDRPPPPPPPTPDAPTVVLLADAGAGNVGRTDGEMAAALATGRITAVLVEADLSTDAACTEVAGPDTIVVTSRGMSAALRACLLAAGTSLIGHDDAGSVLGRDAVALSTAHGAAAALLDLAAWAPGAGAVNGDVGLVSTADLRPVLEPVLGEAQAAGMPIAASAWLPAGIADDAAVSDAVLQFAGAGIGTVVFAAPVELQRRWLARSNLLLATASYLVMDAADAVVDEAYSPLFDGARARSVVKFPWKGRADGGLTDAQADCRQRWEAAAGVILDDAEAARALLWCQHIRIAAAAMAAVVDGADLIDTLRGTRTSSLLTTRLRPRGSNGWGPGNPVALIWRAACTCWESS